MTREEFEALRKLPDKEIQADIAFLEQKDTRPNLTFDGVSVANSLGLDIVLNGTYKPEIPSLTFNFVARGVGPICRLDVNGTNHKDKGRNHKHELFREEDPRLNLPDAVARDDLVGMKPGEVWDLLCKQASIKHTGKFIEP